MAIAQEFKAFQAISPSSATDDADCFM